MLIIQAIPLNGNSIIQIKAFNIHSISLTIALNKAFKACPTTGISNKINNSFTNIKTIPQHCVSANYTITGKKFRYSARISRFINPYKLGFDNDFVDTHFNLPYECIGITEAQKYLNSRMSIVCH